VQLPAEGMANAALVLVHGRRLRGPLFGLGHARVWLLLVVLVVILLAVWVGNRNRR
jgi:hypothetical protein